MTSVSARAHLKKSIKLYDEAIKSIDTRWEKDPDNKDFTPEEERKLKEADEEYEKWHQEWLKYDAQ